MGEINFDQKVASGVTYSIVKHSHQIEICDFCRGFYLVGAMQQKEICDFRVTFAGDSISSVHATKRNM